MYLPIMSISISASQLLSIFADINLECEDQDSDSDQLIQYAEMCFCLLTIERIQKD
jgi:hypothetical protein